MCDEADGEAETVKRVHVRNGEMEESLWKGCPHRLQVMILVKLGLAENKSVMLLEEERILQWMQSFPHINSDNNNIHPVWFHIISLFPCPSLPLWLARWMCITQGARKWLSTWTNESRSWHCYMKDLWLRGTFETRALLADSHQSIDPSHSISPTRSTLSPVFYHYFCLRLLQMEEKMIVFSFSAKNILSGLSPIFLLVSVFLFAPSLKKKKHDIF